MCVHIRVLGRVPLSTFTSDRIPRIHLDLGEFCKDAELSKCKVGQIVHFAQSLAGRPSPRSLATSARSRGDTPLPNLESLGDPSATHRPRVLEDEQGRAPRARAEVGLLGLEPGRTA